MLSPLNGFRSIKSIPNPTQSSVNSGDVSSSIWSLAIEPYNGLDAAEPPEDTDDGGGGVASEYLVLAEPDVAEEEPALAAVGWTASGVVVLVFVGAVVAWM